jgi:hypothetical protein
MDAQNIEVRFDRSPGTEHFNAALGDKAQTLPDTDQVSPGKGEAKNAVLPV